MSNKSSKFKKLKSTQIGNFIVTFEEGKLNSVKITAVSGNWTLRYREDNTLYHWIISEIKTKEGRAILHMTIAMWFSACNGVPDETFLQDVLTAYQNSVDRLRQTIENNSDEEESEIIKEEKNNYNQQHNDTTN